MMAVAFDPYHRWLGIPLEEQPAHYYRLLGLAPFEEDPEVIRDAAERQMAHVRGYGLGKHAALSQTILNELGAAKACLLDAGKKAEYDRRLRRDLAPSNDVPPPLGVDAEKPTKRPQRPVARPSHSSETVETAAAAPQAIDTGRPKPAPGAVPAWKSPLLIGGVAAGLLFVVVLSFLVFSGGNHDSAGMLELKTIATQTAALGREFSLSVEPVDAQAWDGRLRFSLANALPGAVVDPRTGEFTWTPQAPGNHEITVTAASDEGGQEDETTFVVCVLPELPRIGPQIVAEGKELRFLVQVGSPGLMGGELRYSLGPGAAQGATIDPKTSEFAWTPTEEQGPGKYSFTVQVVASGSDNLGDQTTFQVEVQEDNQAPVIIQAAGDQTVKAGEVLRFPVTATDSDQPPNALRYSLAAAPEWVQIDSGSGTVTCTPRPEHAGMNYQVAVRVTDNGQPAPRFTEKTIKIAVAGLGGPSGPVSEMLSAAQIAILSGELPTAWTHLKAAQQAAKSPADLVPLEVFRKAVRDEYGTLQALEELTLAGEPIAIVVEQNGQQVCFKWEGRSQTFAVDQLPWQLTVAVAQRSLAQGDPATSLSTACFLAMDVPGDCQQFIARCGQAGVGAGAPRPGPPGPTPGPWLPGPSPGPLPPQPPPKPPAPKGPFITLDLEKQRSAHELKVDEPLPEGDLYVEISGPESWPVPATFEDNKNQVPVNGRVVIQWNEIPNAEITVKFVDYAGQLKLDVEALYRESSRLRYALTPDEMENLKKTLPKNLQEAKARFAFLDRVGPQMNAKLGQLQSELAREMSRPLAERDGRKISILNTQIRNLQSDMKKGRNEYIRLQKEIPRLQKLTLQVLPRLDNLVSALHNSAKLHYRIFSKTSEDE